MQCAVCSERRLCVYCLVNQSRNQSKEESKNILHICMYIKGFWSNSFLKISNKPFICNYCKLEQDGSQIYTAKKKCNGVKIVDMYVCILETLSQKPVSSVKLINTYALNEVCSPNSRYRNQHPSSCAACASPRCMLQRASLRKRRY